MTVNVKDPPFNAAGDPAVDDTAAFALAVATKQDLYLPPVDFHYRVDGTILVPDRPFKIEGGGFSNFPAGQGGSVIRSHHPTNNVFEISNSLQPAIFRDIAIGAAVGRAGGAAIKFSGAGGPQGMNSWSLLDNVMILEHLVGIDARIATWLRIRSSIIKGMVDNAYGLFLGDTYNSDAGECKIHDTDFVGSPGMTGILHSSGGGFTMSGGKMLAGAMGYVLRSEPGLPFQSGQIIISTVRFDGQSSRSIKFQSGDLGDTINDVIISNNICWNNGSGNFLEVGGSNMYQIQNMLVNGNECHFGGSPNGGGMLFSRSVDVTCINNHLKSNNGGDGIVAPAADNPGFVDNNSNIFHGFARGLVR